MLNNLGTLFLGNLVDLVDEHYQWIEAKKRHDRFAIFFNTLDKYPLQFCIILGKWELLKQLRFVILFCSLFLIIFVHLNQSFLYLFDCALFSGLLIRVLPQHDKVTVESHTLFLHLDKLEHMMIYIEKVLGSSVCIMIMHHVAGWMIFLQPLIRILIWNRTDNPAIILRLRLCCRPPSPWPGMGGMQPANK